MCFRETGPERGMGDVNAMTGTRENYVIRVKTATGRSPKIKHTQIVKVSHTIDNYYWVISPPPKKIVILDVQGIGP